MDSLDIISLIVTILGTFSFSAIFTILYRSYAMSTIAEIKIGTKDIEIIDEVIYERKPGVRRRKEIIKTIKGVLFYLTLFIIVPLFVFSLINKFLDNKLMLGNKTVMVVMSGSMSEIHENNEYLIERGQNNQFATYDIIILNKVNPENLKVDDVIAFRNDEGINVIHRIRERTFDMEKGKIAFITRGDANSRDDEYQPCVDDVIGIYSNMRLKNIGVFIVFLQSYAGIITVVSIVYCMIMIDRLSEKINKVQKERIKVIEEVIDYSLEENTNEFSNSVKASIKFKGFIYIFDENGFVEKIEDETQNNVETADGVQQPDDFNEIKNEEQGD